MATQFEQQVQEWVNRTKAKLRLTNKEVILAVAGSLVGKSPIGRPEMWKDPPPKGYLPGQFKANWRGSFGTVDYTTEDFVDVTGEVSLVQINSAIPEDPTGVFYITNSLPYAQVLEDGGAIHNIPPGGYVALTVLEFDQIAAASILKVKEL